MEEEDKEISIQPNVQEVEFRTKFVRVDDVAPELDDFTLVESDTVVTESVAEIVDEPATAVSVNAKVKVEAVVEVEEVGGYRLKCKILLSNMDINAKYQLSCQLRRHKDDGI